MLIRKTIFTLIIAIAGSMPAVAQAQSAPVVWDDNGNSYQFLFANLTWNQANAAAQASILDGRAGHLVTISSAAENDFVANLIGGDFRAWIGLSDAAVEGSFEWVTGEPLNYENWSSGEPNNSGNEDYVELFASNDSWNDRFNTPFAAFNAAYIIEWDAGPPPSDVFSIAIIPDTQMYVEQHPEVFEAQVDWIVANQGAENIIYVAHLGDLKDDLSCDTKTVNVGTGGGRSEWQIVDDTLGDLDAAGIPYGVVPGNHDFDQVNNTCPNFTTERPLGTYNSLLGPLRFAGLPHYGDPSVPTPGNRVVNSNEDNFTLFDSNGVKFIAINLAYRQGANAVNDDPEVVWADALLKAYPDRLGIITSHYFMDANPGNNLGPYGQEIYDGLSNNPNMFMMLSAHEFGEAWLVETTGRGGMQPVQILLSDYQRDVFPAVDGDINTPPNDPNPAGIDFTDIDQTSFGDSGFMRIMRFDTVTGMVNIETFIPPVIPIKNRPGTLVSTYFPADGNGMDEATASNLSFSYLGYVPISSPVELVSCGIATAGGDGLGRGFYHPSYPGSSLDQVELYISSRAAGSFTIRLDAMLNTYDGALIASNSQTRNLSGVDTDNVSYMFDMGGTAVTPGSIVTFRLTLETGPAGGVFFAVDATLNPFFPTDLGNCDMNQTEGTAAPLDTIRRHGLWIRITGSP